MTKVEARREAVRHAITGLQDILASHVLWTGGLHDDLAAREIRKIEDECRLLIAGWQRQVARPITTREKRSAVSRARLVRKGMLP